MQRAHTNLPWSTFKTGDVRRRQPRRRLTGLAIDATSIFICASSLFLWTYGYARADYASYRLADGTEVGIQPCRGLLVLMLCDGPPQSDGLGRKPCAGALPGTATTWQKRLGLFPPERKALWPGARATQVRYFVPCWLIFSAAAVLPASWRLARSKLHRRRTAGCCLACGYDLRATPDKSGPQFDRCPECGLVAAQTNRPSPKKDTKGDVPE
jgi:hypothetical protein